MKKIESILLIFLLLTLSLGAQAFVDFESGLAFSGYNDVQIPADTGTRFSLAEVTPSSAVPMFRIRAGYTFKERHTVSLLVAPLTVQGTGTADQDISFGGTTFLSGSEITSTYRFDSYRLTYRWTFFKKETLNLGVGLTGKIRSADIALAGEDGYAHRDDLGVVPLINFRTEWYFADRFGLLLDGDALLSPYGRAEDINLALLYRHSDKTTLRIGYRVLEGGSDGGGDVYTFALINFITAGMTVSF